MLIVLLQLTQGLAAQELRGIWVTPRTGGSFWSKAEIARTMDTIAAANFNVVYFNAWSRGFPLFRSDVFFRETGYYTDPAAGERDILQEAIAEAHRNGLEIEAWMEYGFAGWWSGYSLPGFPKGPLFDRRPSWLGKDASGNDLIPSPEGGIFFYWLAHNNDEPRSFLIELHEEIARRYDVDGIELDRIRYPNLNFGYDSASVVKYTAATGSAPPVDGTNSAWKRWRADQLVTFHAAVYDSIKAANPNVVVSNAPSHYASGLGSYPAYDNVLQDWKAWLELGKLDAAQVQMYQPSSVLMGYIPSALYGLTSASQQKVNAGIAIKPNNTLFSLSEGVNLIQASRNAGLKGHAWWYYNDLRDAGYMVPLRNQVYPTKATPPHREEGWRPTPVFAKDSAATRTGFVGVNYVSGWNGSVFYADANGADTMRYAVTVAESGIYELYAHIPTGLNALTSSATYLLHDTTYVPRTVVVDQAGALNAGWTRLGDVVVPAGGPVTIVTLTNAGIGTGKNVVGDDLMLLRNRRVSPGTPTSVSSLRPEAPYSFVVHPPYPNPFNPSTTIAFDLQWASMVRVTAYDMLGRAVATIADGPLHAGRHQRTWEPGGVASGVYLIEVRVSPDGRQHGTEHRMHRRVVLMK
ncbi:MAG: family 10 glycosylhydrolase [Bacteroidetes bacterium]|jgi:uncharacterized lipoprotein YddW (UPF0748 family)|nr:family 10 glycosylhydrolase [Bacteroidota bacterium]